MIENYPLHLTYVRTLPCNVARLNCDKMV